MKALENQMLENQSKFEKKYEEVEQENKKLTAEVSYMEQKMNE